MSAAIDFTRFGRRPSPRTLEEVATIARRGHHRLRASVRLHDGRSGEVFFDGATVVHAKLGWAIGRRALDRLRVAEPFEHAAIQLHAMPDMITLGEAWAGRVLAVPRLQAATPRLSWRARGVEPVW
ncbi:hypothetical protein [Paraliomyxa miuraensis]|uniref:hypothetical protein n=1 Tax=Paraliomyxa miuraensis TaxID=376150 RepID=UPI002259A8AF|nr:hypothetical protein [Paraliomyxa miuraensis]MCX4241129.1 hypothetical protein [Paraliomyxa miuraensis]